jgi:hypothetical protein
MRNQFFALAAVCSGFFLLVSIPAACYYDNEVEQYGVSACDTTAISFSQDILPIINGNCISCHTPGGQQESSPFTNHSEIKTYGAGMVERVNGVGGIMPPDGSIPSCDKLKIEAWVKAGAPNN